MGLVKVYITKNEIEATMIKHILENNSIPCQLFNENNSRLLADVSEGDMAGIEIVVPEEFRSKSERFIKDLRTGTS